MYFRVLQSWKVVGFLQKEFSGMDFRARIWECLKCRFSYQHVNCSLCPLVGPGKSNIQFLLLFWVFYWGRWRIYFNYYCIKLDFVNAKPILTMGHDYLDLLEKNFPLCKSQTMDRFQMMVSPNLWGCPIAYYFLKQSKSVFVDLFKCFMCIDHFTVVPNIIPYNFWVKKTIFVWYRSYIFSTR